MSKATTKSSRKKKPNIILWLGIIVLLIPCIILGIVLASSLEKTGEPVVVNRFKNELNPAITESDLSKLQGALVYENVDKIEVNLKSATLRIMVNIADSMEEGDILWLIDNAYTKVAELLPIETYFTNSPTTKMYDLEIHVYNVTKGSDALPQIYYTKSKSAGAEAPIVDHFSQAKKPELSENLLNPPEPEEQEADPDQAGVDPETGE